MARPFLAPEVLQISSMDCGVAALSCMLAGLGADVSYEKLREACQTSVDGTSIDALEDVCLGLGVDVCQHVIPVDLFLDAARERMPMVALVDVAGPAAVHYVCLWRVFGGRLQVMDPRGGRQWLARARLEEQLHVHVLPLPVDTWRAWMATSAFLEALRLRARALLSPSMYESAVAPALAALDPEAFGSVDAALRLVAKAAGVASKPERWRDALFERALNAAREGLLPETLRRVTRRGDVVLTEGAVLLGSPEPRDDSGSGGSIAGRQAAVRQAGLERVGSASVWREVLRLVGPSGRRLLVWLALGTAALAVATTAELLVYRAALDAPRLFTTWGLRLTAATCVAALLAALIALEALSAWGARKLGRVVELEMRVATLWSLPRVSDAFVRSRPISDLAYRAHLLSAAGHVVSTVVAACRAGADVLVTLAAIAWLDPRYAVIAIAGAALFTAPWLALRSTLQDIDTKLQVHAARMLVLLLDALRGLRPVRLHGFQDPLRDEQMRELEQWRGTAAQQVEADAQLEAGFGTVSVGVLSALFFAHLATAGDARAFVLLALWSFRIPAAVRTLVSLAQALPLQRNAVGRLLEITHYAAPAQTPRLRLARSGAGVAISLRGVSLVAGGQTILTGIDLSFAPGEHVAIVGGSGAGKSSLVGALLGFHQPAAGSVLIDGCVLDESLIEELREISAWIDPAVHLWNASLGANFEYAAKGVQRRAVLDVLEEADLLSVLAGVERGLDTPLGAEGAFVSGGEGQRVRVGRALLRASTRLAILDEPFRGLERTARSEMLTRVRGALQRSTLFFVSHDIAESLAFDRVLVVADGAVVEDGAPSELAARDTAYASMLRAEREVLAEAWSPEAWRVVRVGEGAIREEAS